MEVRLISLPRHFLACLLFEDVSTMDVNEFLSPFLAVIRSEVTTGPITGVALSSVHKFLTYGLIGKLFVQEFFFSRPHGDELIHRFGITKRKLWN